MDKRRVSPLTKQRAFATIKLVAKAVLSGEQALTYSQLALRLGMSKVNGQGLSSYLNEAAALCAEHSLPNVSVLVVSKDSLDQGRPMPSEGSFTDGFYASTGLTKADIPAEQERVRMFDWKSVRSLNLE
ncbi:hypothetical protein [Tabrizicola sp.]|uniref:hypothetical protein n=1 Tax=Tabrizicola sp. TaxID=2005166 RepID=UPI002FDE1B2D